MTRNTFLIAAVGSVAAICIVCSACLLFVALVPSSRNNTTTNAPTDSSIPGNPNVGLTYEDISTNAKHLTEIKRNEYYKSLIGESVQWSGTVADVSASGDIHIRILSPIGYNVVLQGADKTLSASLNLNDSVAFDGTITDVVDTFGSGIPIITIKATPANKQ